MTIKLVIKNLWCFIYIGMYKTNPTKEDFIKYKSFEPKLSNRFVVKIDDIPSYVIKSVSRPSITRNWLGNFVWNPVDLVLYDPITPSSADAVMSKIIKKSNWNFNVMILGPVGDNVEEWRVECPYLISSNFSSLDWSSKENLLIYIKLKVKVATLLV